MLCWYSNVVCVCVLILCVCVWHVVCVCDIWMRRSFLKWHRSHKWVVHGVRHDSCDMVCATWCATWLVVVCDMTRSYTWHDASICVCCFVFIKSILGSHGPRTWSRRIIQNGSSSHILRARASYPQPTLNPTACVSIYYLICVTSRIHVCDMTHSVC